MTPGAYTMDFTVFGKKVDKEQFSNIYLCSKTIQAIDFEEKLRYLKHIFKVFYRWVQTAKDGSLFQKLPLGNVNARIFASTNPRMLQLIKC